MGRRAERTPDQSSDSREERREVDRARNDTNCKGGKTP